MTFITRKTSSNAERGTSQEFEVYYNDTTTDVGYNDEANIFIPIGGGKGLPYGISAGTGTAYTVTTTPAVVGNTDGQPIEVKFHLANTITNPTLSVGGATVKTIVDQGGTSLDIGQIKINVIYELIFNSTLDAWELIGEADNGTYLTSLTKAQADTLVAANQLIPGKFYRITDRGVIAAQSGIVLLAVATNRFSLQGSQIWASANNPSQIQYDFINDIFIYFFDRLGNIVNPNSFATFQFNNANVSGNQATTDNRGIVGIFIFTNNLGLIQNNIHQGINLTATNQAATGSINDNVIQPGSSLIATTNAGTIQTSIFANAVSVTANLTNGFGISGCYFSGNGFAITLLVNKSENGKTIERGYSNFQATGAFGLTESDYNAGTQTLTIPVTYSYFGVIELNLNSGRSITNIINLPTNHPVKFICANAKTVTFVPTAIAGVGANNIVLESLSNLTLTGRTNGPDYLILQNASTFQTQIEASVLS